MPQQQPSRSQRAIAIGTAPVSYEPHRQVLVAKLANLKKGQIRPMPSQEQNARMGAIPRGISVTPDIVPSSIRASVDSGDLEPGESICLRQALHPLQTENVKVEHIRAESADLLAERHGGPIDPLANTGNIEVVGSHCELGLYWQSRSIRGRQDVKGRLSSRRQPGERSWRLGGMGEVFVDGVDGARGGGGGEGGGRKGDEGGGAHPYAP